MVDVVINSKEDKTDIMVSLDSEHNNRIKAKSLTDLQNQVKSFFENPEKKSDFLVDPDSLFEDERDLAEIMEVLKEDFNGNVNISEILEKVDNNFPLKEKFLRASRINVLREMMDELESEDALDDIEDYLEGSFEGDEELQDKVIKVYRKLRYSLDELSSEFMDDSEISKDTVFDFTDADDLLYVLIHLKKGVDACKKEYINVTYSGLQNVLSDCDIPFEADIVFKVYKAIEFLNIDIEATLSDVKKFNEVLNVFIKEDCKEENEKDLIVKTQKDFDQLKKDILFELNDERNYDLPWEVVVDADKVSDYEEVVKSTQGIVNNAVEKSIKKE